jgi:hypothetical protein
VQKHFLELLGLYDQEFERFFEIQHAVDFIIQSVKEYVINISEDMGKIYA